MTSGSVGTIYYTTGGPTTRNRGKLVTVTTAIKDSDEAHPEVRATYPETSVDEKDRVASKLRSVVRKRPMANGKSLADEYTRSLEIRPSSISKISIPFFVVRGNSMKKISYSTERDDDYKNTVVKDGQNVEAETETTVVQKAHQKNDRQNQKQIFHNNFSTTQSGTLELKTKSPFDDLPYTIGDYETKTNVNSVYGTGRSIINGSKQILSSGSSIFENLGNNGFFRKPPFGLKARYSVNQRDYSRDDTQPVIIGQVEFNGQILNRYSSPTYGIYLGTQPLPEPGGSQPQPPTSVIMPQSPNMNIQPPRTPIVQNPSPSIPAQQMTFGLSIILILFAVLKFSLVNLKTISFLKLLFLFWFKLKFVLKVLTFKTLLLLNVLFFKVCILPLLILLLWPIFHHLYLHSAAVAET